MRDNYALKSKPCHEKANKMPELKNIHLIRAKSATIDLWGTPLAVKYLPQSFTPKMIRQLREAGNLEATEANAMESAEEGVDALVGAFLSAVVQWDLTSGGEPVPLTVEGLDEIDMSILTEILRQIRETQSPNEPSGTPTSSPSSATESAE